MRKTVAKALRKLAKGMATSTEPHANKTNKIFVMGEIPNKEDADGKPTIGWVEKVFTKVINHPQSERGIYLRLKAEYKNG